jgi:hypothetical protein
MFVAALKLHPGSFSQGIISFWLKSIVMDLPHFGSTRITWIGLQPIPVAMAGWRMVMSSSGSQGWLTEVHGKGQIWPLGDCEPAPTCSLLQAPSSHLF